MSAKDQIKQIVDFFKREPQLKDKTDGMAEGLLLGAQLADDANELSKETDASFKALQREYTENGNGAQTTAEINVARDGELVLDDRLKRDFGNVNRQLAHMHYDVVNEGVVPGVGIDNTQALKTLIARLKDGDTLFFPPFDFITTDTIIITKAITLIMKGRIVCDHNKIGIQFKDDSLFGSFHQMYHKNQILKGNLRIIRVKNKGFETDVNSIGVDFWNVFSSEINLEEIDGHHSGVRYCGDKYGTGYAGSTYCKSNIGIINSYKENIIFEAINEGYVTQNQFYGGSLTGSDNNLETIHVNFLNKGTSVINENSFYGTSFEGGFKKAVKGNKSNSNKFINCRYEMPNMTMLFDFEGCRFNEFLASNYVAEAMYKGLYNDNGSTPNLPTNTKVSFIEYRLGLVDYYDRIFYVKPNGNFLGSANTVINGLPTTPIPNHWDVRILTDGLSDLTINSSATNTTNRILDVPIKVNNVFTTVEQSQSPFDVLRFINPPRYSTKITVKPSVSGSKPLELRVDGSISQLIDRTGEGLISPVGRVFIELYYDYKTNRLYILDYI